MATPLELTQAVKDTRIEAEMAILDCNDKWEVKPAGAEGEETWCSQEIAQHLIGAEYFFTNMIAQACGAPAMERPEIDVSTPAAAAESLRAVGDKDDNILRHVSEGDLTKTWETRNLGTRTVQEMLEIVASHGRDHINQIRSANA